MNKSDLVKEISAKADLTKDQATKAVDAFLETAVEGLKSGKGLALKGFGSFTVQERPARTGRNPKTSAVIEIPAKKIAKFKFSTEIKKELN